MENREPGHIRINPPFFSPRKYYFKQLRKQIENVIAGYVKNRNYKTLIDYGCGNCPYQPFFMKQVGEYFPADFADNPAASIPLNPDGSIPGNDGKFDIVLSTQVLEHVSDPSRYLSEALRVIKQTGILILSTHGYWMYHPDPVDYWRWTSAGLEKIITEAGFEIIYFTGILGRNASGLQLFQDGFYFKLPSFLKPLWAVMMQWLISFTDKLNSREARNRDACTFILVAKVKS